MGKEDMTSVLKNVLMVVGSGVILIHLFIFLAGFFSGFVGDSAMTTTEAIEVYEQGHEVNSIITKFEVREIVEHPEIGQSLWSNDEFDAAYITNGKILKNVEIGDTVRVKVTKIYKMFGSYILEFDTEDAELIRGGE